MQTTLLSAPLLTRIVAEVTRLLLDGHKVECSLVWRARGWWTRGAHGGDALLCVPWVDELLLKHLGRYSYQWLRHLPVVWWPAVTW